MTYTNAQLDELDAAIAQAQGFSVCADADCGGCDARVLKTDVGWRVRRSATAGTDDGANWSPTRNIADAMELVEELRQAKSCITLWTDYFVAKSKTPWHAQISLDSGGYAARRETLPLAIACAYAVARGIALPEDEAS